jgi:CHAT domain-containing protein
MADGVFAPPLLTNAVSNRSLRSGSVVFINACHSAGAVDGFVNLSGWAHKFLAAGAAAFIGTNWAVRTSASSEFAASLYEQLTRGAALGTAAHRARQSLRSGEDPSWLAYSVYGSAAATVPESSPWPPPGTPPRARS